MLEHTHENHDFLAANQQVRSNERKTFLVALITVSTMLVEILAGYWSGSMSLLADGWHMGSHAGAIGIATLAYRWSRNKQLQSRLTFGAGKLIPLGGYTSATLLALVACFMTYESVVRLIHPVKVQFKEAIGVAVFGLLINLVSAAILHSDEDDHFHLDREAQEHGHSHHDHNLQGAYLHVVADAFTSVLAVIALASGWLYGWTWLDPAVGIVGSAVILVWAYNLIRDSAWDLLDGDATCLDQAQFRKFISDQFSVEVLDLHIWRVAPKSFCCELVLRTSQPRGANIYRDRIIERYNFAHLVIEERTKTV